MISLDPRLPALAISHGREVHIDGIGTISGNPELDLPLKRALKKSLQRQDLQLHFAPTVHWIQRFSRDELFLTDFTDLRMRQLLACGSAMPENAEKIFSGWKRQKKFLISPMLTSKEHQPCRPNATYQAVGIFENPKPWISVWTWLRHSDSFGSLYCSFSTRIRNGQILEEKSVKVLSRPVADIDELIKDCPY